LVQRLTTAGVMTALLTIGAAPAMAASPDKTGPTPISTFSTKSIAKVVAASEAPAKAPKAAKQATSSGSFFKTRTGMLVIAVMAVGTGYAVYSFKEDRIRGLNR
jgi:hypothetical protein